jgi:hypothetical protein
MTRPRLAVVSYLYDQQHSPRGIRSRALVRGLGAEWDIELIKGGTASGNGGGGRSSPMRRALTEAARSVLIDGLEPWSRRQFRPWRPAVDLALLIGYPYSPMVAAARRLARAGIPYVIDVGDPWVMTSADPLPRHLGLRRARRAERRMWERAAGAIVTTDAQAGAASAEFPGIPLLVRPNGYQEVPPGEPRREPRAEAPLRLVHFGRMYLPRLDVAPLLVKLARSDAWPSVVIRQHGDDAEGALQRLPAPIEVEYRVPVPWHKAVSIARDFDLALVVGNKDPNLLPSKVIDYLTLPIPRLAIVGGGERQAIRDYVRDKPGWLVVSGVEPDLDRRIAAHRSRAWTSQSLAPPDEEAWPRAVAEVADFLRQRLRNGA